MAISLSISPPGMLSSEIEETTRALRSVNATISASGSGGESIDSVTAVLNGGTEPGIVITPGTTSVSIVGTYTDPFSDVFTFVSKGSSNKIETPTTVINTENMPSNRELYNLDQDLTQIETKTYTVTVGYDSTSSEQFVVTHNILNDLESIRSFMDTYYD